MTFSKLAKYSVILSIIPALYVCFFPGKIVLVSIICAYPLLIGVLFEMGELYKSKEQIKKNFEGAFYINAFVYYNLIVFSRGLYDMKSEQDWVVMFSSTIPLFLVIHFSIYLAAYRAPVIAISKAFLTYGLILSLFIYLFLPPSSSEFVKSVSPIYILIFMIPYINKKFQIVIIIVALISFLSDFSNRSNLLNIIIAFLIMTSFFWRKKKWLLSIIKSARVVLIFSPIFFLILGLVGVFNIFLIGNLVSEYSLDIGNGNKQDLLVDSRTSIYTDVFSQLKEEDAFIFGLGASGKTKTSLSDISYGNYDVIYKEGRRQTESGMLNYIQWGGLIGGLVYFLLFVKASYLAIYKSKNWFCVMLGLWVAYKGLFSFIEDSNYFGVSSIFIFLSIGICLSKKIRCLDDSELKLILHKSF